MQAPLGDPGLCDETTGQVLTTLNALVQAVERLCDIMEAK